MPKYSSGWVELDNFCNYFFNVWQTDVKNHNYGQIRLKLPGMIERNKLLFLSQIPIPLMAKREQIIVQRNALNNFMAIVEDVKLYSGEHSDQAMVGSVTDARFQTEVLFLLCTT